MTRARALLGTFALAALASCSDAGGRVLPPFGQLLVYVDTDAPLPAPPGVAPKTDDVPPLFDRVRIEVFRPGEAAPCADCTHEFDLDRDMVAAHRASVGVSPPVGVTGYRARVRLFSARFVELGQPRADTTIDTTVSLPATAYEGITEVTVPLATEDVAKVRGTPDAPLGAQDGPPKPGFSGSWPRARRVSCKGTPDDDEVCVPGGAYWMGNPLARVFLQPGEPVSMRLVVLDPFFIEKTEVTVGSFRKSGLATVSDPQRYSSGQDPGAYAPCTYTSGPGNDENLPVTCISWERAHAYCTGRGRELPTEAQHQYAASGLEGRLFLWGDAPPSCNDAIFARGHHFMQPLITCPGEWLEPPGRGVRDRLELPGGVVLDLAGNVAEHARDLFAPNDDACWGTGVFTNPVCTAPSHDNHGVHTVTGGAWAAPGAAIAAASRGPWISFQETITSPSLRDLRAPALAGVGFRCARDDG